MSNVIEQTISFMGLEINPFTYEQLHETIEKSIREGLPKRIFNVNVHAMNLCFSNSDFYQVMKNADYVFTDGEGVRQAIQYIGSKIPYRITYADWIHLLLPWLSEKGFSIAFLGASDDVLLEVQKVVSSCYPDLKLAGCVSGYLPESEQVKCLSQINADVLLVGMGMPLQELWIERNQQHLSFSVYLTGGAVFDYISGRVSRAPKFMRKYGLEWLYRFCLEPRRLFYRYIIGNPQFMLRVLMSKNPINNGL